MKSFINAISYYLPENILSNDILNIEFPEWSVDKISAKTGIYERRIAGTNEFAGDMAFNAAKKLFNEWNINAETIDFILYCTQSPDYFLPTTACILQNQLGLNTSVGALDFNLGCSGYVYGLSLAKGLITSNAAKNILLITSETYSKFINPKDKSNRTIFGDAASATLISTEPGIAEIGDFSFGTDGSGSDFLIVKNGGIRNKEMVGENVFEEGNYLRNDDNLFMDGKAIFNFSAQAVPILVENTLRKNDCAIEDIDLFVFHQANRYMLNFIRKKINIPENKFYLYLEKCGNTVSSTIPIALYNANLDSKLRGNVLLAGFGVGLSWAGVILKQCYDQIP
jgi:3-oxoacyl-[acyl-carrier-protein] synthase-3